ncbi:ATP-grasp domain-containing protein [Halorarius litoreus]|uniref:ATP-grasp domain-containing protein n=1 Tax=Halorarius litoreus TaxID=2962676 RepID=UPI0020CBF462|nr:ATP-grasp domain-containing protein [Halorarius litoreus]
MSHTTPTHRHGNDNQITVLMTGAGAPGASGIIRSLRANGERDIRIVGTDVNPDAYGFALLDGGYTVPRGTDDGYIDRMVEIAAEVQPDVILPLTTAELQPLAEHKAAFDATVMVSDPTALELANDKGKLYEFLADHGFASAPRFQRVTSIDEFVETVEAFGYPEEPVCFKRPVASGMRGFRVLDERTDRLTQLLSEKPMNAVTTLDEVRPVLAGADPFPDLVVMEYLPGVEYSVDVLATGDDVHVVVPRSRSRTRAGISFEGTVEEDAELIREATDICRALGVEYNLNLQFKYDAEGTPRIIEINPRVSGTIIMCVGAGANLPYLGVKHALGEDLPPVDVQWGTRMVRHWDELFHSPDGETFRVDAETAGPWSLA